MTYIELINLNQSYEETLKSITHYKDILSRVEIMLNSEEVNLQGITYNTDVLSGCFSFDYTKIDDKLKTLRNTKKYQEQTLKELDNVLATVKIKEL